MRHFSDWLRWLSGVALCGASLGLSERADGQELARVSVNRALRVGGLSVDEHAEDVLGLARIKFQGLIATELSSVGYRIDEATDALASGAARPLTLIGIVKEEVCDDDTPPQCRVAIQWELQDARGAVQYRTTTRAVEQAPTWDKQRRGLVQGALRSLMQRRRFALQLMDVEHPVETAPVGPLGFKQCKRPVLELPRSARAVAAAVVLVESGSNLALGSIVSGDGLILTSAKFLDASAPLRVRFSAEQTLPAKVLARDDAADVALLHVAAETSTTCLPIRDTDLTVGAAIFGVSSEPGEERAISLAGSVVQQARANGTLQRLGIDPLIARAEGAPLLDEQGRLGGIVTAESTAQAAAGRGLAGLSALRALGLKPAAITDPRLLGTSAEPSARLAYIHDADDPAFVMDKRYTYGTSNAARQLRKASEIGALVGGITVAGTWLSFRGSSNLSASGHQRLVVFNDIGWTLLGLGVVGFGASYVLPEGHEVVAVRTAARRQLFVGIGAGGLELGGRI